MIVVMRGLKGDGKGKYRDGCNGGARKVMRRGDGKSVHVFFGYHRK